MNYDAMQQSGNPMQSSLLTTYWRALTYLAPASAKVATICTANVLLAAVAIAEPIFFGRIIDAISEDTPILDPLVIWGTLGLFNIIAFVLVSRSADRLSHELRASVTAESFERLITMPLAWHQAQGSSAALHTLLRAMETLFSLWLEFMRQHLSTAVALVLLVPTAISLDLRMSLVLLILGVLYVLISRLVMKRTQKGQASVERHYQQVFAHLADSIGNVTVLQSYGRLAEESALLRRQLADLVSAQRPVLDWWALASALHRLASTISMIAVVVIGSILVSRGELRIGEIVAFTGFATLLISRLDQVSGFVSQVFDARAKLEPFYRLEDAAAEREEPAGATEMPRVRGDIEFDRVDFRFPGSGNGVEDLSFRIEAGQTVAIVGPTGAGKTTLINLLQRARDPHAGTIRIDGIDISSVTRASLRRNIATVFQDAGLLDRTIEANIRIGREGASNADVHAAAEAASAHDFILQRRDGYDTVAGERGSSLSGGERQRVAIARAVLKDAPILVLDEATSALDVETEEKVKQAVDRLRRGRTTLIIAHRLSTVRNADVVIVMDGGRIAEMGPFSELASRGGRFSALLSAGGLTVEPPRESAEIIAIRAA
jgi:ATP-binding cassette subfamily B protein